MGAFAPSVENNVSGVQLGIFGDLSPLLPPPPPPRIKKLPIIPPFKNFLWISIKEGLIYLVDRSYN
jgi:hypothetical protein